MFAIYQPDTCFEHKIALKGSASMCRLSVLSFHAQLGLSLILSTAAMAFATAQTAEQPPIEVSLSCPGVAKTLVQPVMEVVLENQPACLMVDTGSDQTVVDNALGRLILGKRRHATGDEAAGKKFDLNYVTDVPIEIKDHRATLSLVAIADLDPSLAKAGVQGILSPQRLLPSFAILLDLSSGKLMAFKSTTDMQRWIRSLEPRVALTRVPVRMGDNSPTVRMSIDGHQAIPLLLDTGAQRTVLPSGYLAFSSMTQGTKQTGASGLAHHYYEIPSVSVSIGDLRLGTHTLLMTPAGQPGTPRIGMDLLSNFQIALPRGGIANAWLLQVQP